MISLFRVPTPTILPTPESPPCKREISNVTKIYLKNRRRLVGQRKNMRIKILVRFVNDKKTENLDRSIWLFFNASIFCSKQNFHF